MEEKQLLSAADFAKAWRSHLEQNDTRAKMYSDVYDTFLTAVRHISFHLFIPINV